MGKGGRGRGRQFMTRFRLALSLCLVVLFQGQSVFADGFDDCLDNCGQNLAPCIDQARLTAGNVQEEQDMIAACNKTKSDCIQGCRDAEAQPQTQPQPQPQEQSQEQSQEQPQEQPQQQPQPPPQEQPQQQPQEQQGEDTLNGLKIYKFQ